MYGDCKTDIIFLVAKGRRYGNKLILDGHFQTLKLTTFTLCSGSLKQNAKKLKFFATTTQRTI